VLVHICNTLFPAGNKIRKTSHLLIHLKFDSVYVCMERYLKKPHVPSHAPSFGCLQEWHLPHCQQSGSMLQDTQHQFTSWLVSSAPVQSLSNAHSEMSQDFRAGSSGERGTRLLRKAGPQSFCLPSAKAGCWESFLFRDLRKKINHGKSTLPVVLCV